MNDLLQTTVQYMTIKHLFLFREEFANLDLSNVVHMFISVVHGLCRPSESLSFNIVKFFAEEVEKNPEGGESKAD